MLIEIYADVLCAWAYVGKRRLETALDLVRQQGEEPTVVWRPYLIDPTAPAVSEDLQIALQEPSIDAALQQCEPGLSAWENRIRVRDEARAEGIGPDFGARWRTSSWAAHRMVTAAAEQGPQMQDEVMESFLRAHFVEGRDINDLTFLRELATAYALPQPLAGTGDTALVYMERGVDPEDPLERATREALLTGRAIGVASSPTFVVNGHSALAGAQSAEVLARHILEAGERQPHEQHEVVRRFRLAEALLDQRDPHGCRYLLKPLRPDYDGDRNLEQLTARALAASASLGPAREKLERLVEEYPSDAYLHLLLGKTLKRLGDPDAARHLALAGEPDPVRATPRFQVV